MQIKAILRGCVAAYGVGVLIVWADYLWSYQQGTLHVFGPWGSLFVSVVYGGLAALVVSAFVGITWILLAWRRVTVRYDVALAVGAIVTALLSRLLSSEWVATAIALLVGAIFGATFWLASFGRRRSVTMRF